VSPAVRQPPPPHRNRGVRTLWLIFGAVLCVGALTWGAYEVVSILSHEERTEINTYPSAGLTTVDIGNDGGSVRIVATDGDEVVVRAEISEGLRATGERQEVVGDVLELRATCPNFGSDWCGVSYELQVPRDLALVVRADSGSVDVTGMTGVVDVDADNGSVELTGLRGTIRASTDNGRVEGFDLRSQSVTVDSDNGGVTLEFTEAPTTVMATTDNGSVEVVVPDDGEAYRIDVQSDNGSETDDVLEDPASPRSITIHTDNGSATARTAP
jgi:Putative adhesin